MVKRRSAATKKMASNSSDTKEEEPSDAPVKEDPEGQNVEAGNCAQDNETSPVNQANSERKEIFPGTRTNIVQHEVTFGCSYQFKPEMLEYYYSPGPSGYDGGNPILLGSPAFDGGFSTRWRICLTINKWIDTRRWMSLFLARLDKSTAPGFVHMQVQCEFRILDKDGRVVHTRRNLICETIPNKTCGFTQFLPFEHAAGMMNDGCLRIEAHVILLAMRVDQTEDGATQAGETANNVKGDIMGAVLVPVEEEKQSYVYDQDIAEGNRIAFSFEGEFLICANKEKLQAKSQQFAELLKIGMSEFKDQLNFGADFDEGMSNNEQIKRAICEFVQHINTDTCRILEIGSYEDILRLLQFAKKMKTEQLMAQCVTALCVRVTPVTAALHVTVGFDYIQFMSEEDQESFYKYFKQNFKEIRKSEYFKIFIDKIPDALSLFAFAPNHPVNL